MEEYARRRQKKSIQYTRSLLDLCEGSKKAPRTQVRMQWWEEAVINLAGEGNVTSEIAEEEMGKE